MKYCSYCGKQLNDGEVCNCLGAQEEQSTKTAKSGKNMMKNIKKLAIPIAIILVILIAVISITSYIGSEIDLTEYIVIEEVTGLNGQGVLSYTLDEDALTKALWGEVSNEEVTDDNFEAVMLENMEKYDEIGNALSCITLSASQEAGLSNGDTVTVTATFENTENYKFSYHFKDGSQSYTVSGLVEGKTINPLDEKYVAVSFSGFSGQGKAVIEVLSDEEPISLFRYSLSQYDRLCNGDTVTLMAEADEDKLLELGYFLPKSLEKSFTVTGLGEYFDIADDFPSEELTDVCNKVTTYVKELEQGENDYHFTVTVPSVIHGAYFLKASDPTEPHKDWGVDLTMDNAVAVVASYTVEINGPGSEREKWFVWIFPNYSEGLDGTISYQTEEKYSYAFQDETLEEIEAWFGEEYYDMIVTKLDVQ